MSYRISTEKSWYDTISDLETTFERWGVRDHQVAGRPLTKPYQSVEERRVAVRFLHPTGREIVVSKEDQARAVDNLRALYLALEDMRMLEKRGLAGVMQEAFLQLGAATRARDPFEILGVRSDAPMEVIEASYRAQAKRMHPDVGGKADEFKALQEAWERVKAERS